MRVVYLVAGAGGMYCGSCLRDNRLAATLRRLGRDVVVIPLYTPIRTDETDVSETEVSYGGINVYLDQHSGLFRGLPAAAHRLLNAKPLLRLAGRFAGATRPEELAALTVSVLEGSHGHQRRELQLLIDRLTPLEPDIVHLPNLMFAGVAADLSAHLGCRMFCSLAGEDIFLDALPEPHKSKAAGLIRRHAADIEAFVAPTNYYARFAASRFGIHPDRIRYAPLGIDVDGAAQPPQRTDGTFTIGYLARICPEKGLHILADAFIRLRQAGRNCRLRAAGYLGRADRPYLEETLQRLDRAGLADDFEYIGEVTRAQKLQFLHALDVLSVPTLYHEAKGLYVLEAMACGIPVVQPRHGSFPELIDATGGGILYEPNEPEPLADALARLMDDHDLRRRLAAAGKEAVHLKFTDKVMAEATWAHYEQPTPVAGVEKPESAAGR